jgi:hypothetical protein
MSLPSSRGSTRLCVCVSIPPHARAQSKLEQVASLGCCSFALFFDDIPSGLSPEDGNAFDSFAHAQASVANAIFGHLMPRRLLFCPTEYCASRAVPSVVDSVYLRTLGAELNPLIAVFWTGPDVVPREIPTSDIEAVTATLGRKPLLWDNIHANDYEVHSRVFMGAYDGRRPELRSLLLGVLTNPNCEYSTNYVPLHTLGAWVRLGGAYDPQTALVAAIDDWLFAFQGRPSPKLLGSPSPDARRSLRIADEDMRALVAIFSLPWQPSEPFTSLARDVTDILAGRAGSPRRASVLARCERARHTIDRLRRTLPRTLGDDLRAYLWNAAEVSVCACVRVCACVCVCVCLPAILSLVGSLTHARRPAGCWSVPPRALTRRWNRAPPRPRPQHRSKPGRGRTSPRRLRRCLCG